MPRNVPFFTILLLLVLLGSVGFTFYQTVLMGNFEAIDTTPEEELLEEEVPLEEEMVSEEGEEAPVEEESAEESL